MLNLRFGNAALCAAIVASAVAWTTPASAGPWTRSLGSWYTKLGVNGYLANGFVAAGVRQEGAKYRSLSPSVYAEVGVAKNFHLQAYVPYLLARNDFSDAPNQNVLPGANAQFARLSMGDVLLAAQWSSPWITIPHAIRAEVKLPLYNVNAGGTKNSAGDPIAQFFPAPGDGQLDVIPWLSVGDSFDSVPLFLLAEFGYMFRTETFLVEEPGLLPNAEFNDSLRWFGQAGLKFLEDKYLLLNFLGQWPIGDDPQAITKGFVDVAGGVFWTVGGGFALEAMVGYDVYVTNSSQGTSISVGLSHSK